MVMQAMGMAPTRPADTVPLGDPALIYMDMAHASRYFGVAAPSGKRDRKSGAKKRSQHQTELARNPRYQEMASAAE